MYKEYIQTTYTSQIDKNIIRTENKMKTNYAMHILKVLIGDHVEVYIRNGCILMHTAGSRGCSTI